MKKHWIYIKRGLSEDPKHRAQMGERIWLYLHIIDRADWETGIAYDWKDEQEAADMGMPVRTLREWRRKLDEDGYINCRQKQYTQDIFITKWINPRDYSGRIINQGDINLPPSEIQGYMQGSTQDVTPTLDSKSSLNENVFKLYEQEIGNITPFIAEAMNYAEQEYTPQWVAEAIRIAAQANKRNWMYVEGILKRSKEAGKSPNLNRPKSKQNCTEKPPIKIKRREYNDQGQLVEVE